MTHVTRGRDASRRSARTRQASPFARITVRVDERVQRPVKAAYIDSLGGPDQIRYGELPDPVPAPGQVLVRVHAVAVNSVDTLLRSGRWRSEVDFPLALGRDLVGTIAALGPGVDQWEPGERVWTNSAGYGGRAGATADLVAVEQERLYRLPSGADPVSFVAAVHPGATAHGALVGRARLQGGECVAVVGANGAVGMCMVQLAVALGCEVVAVVRDTRAAERLMRAIERVTADQALHTPDLGGKATTRQVTDAVIAALMGDNA